MFDLIALPALLLAVLQVYSIAFPSKIGKFNVINDKPFLIVEGGGGPAGNALDLKGDQLIHYGSNKALAYALEGEDNDNVVGLSSRDQDSTRKSSIRWDIRKIKDVPSGQSVTIQAADGKFKGWYLDCSQEDETIFANDQKFVVRKLVLSKEPKIVSEFLKYPVAP